MSSPATAFRWPVAFIALIAVTVRTVVSSLAWPDFWPYLLPRTTV